MQYRKEIDGLRALAVLPVILFHGGFQTFSGGFVGVDVFFVISGYLITSIIVAELNAGTFTLAGFYERRARRILPALFLVLFTCLPLAWLWLMPAEFTRFAKSLISVNVLASNFFFALESGSYFSNHVELQPLLHTWSLAVEEHYYLLFPLFMLLAWNWGCRRIAVVIALLALASFVAAELLTPHFPSFSFYVLPTRGWEIAAGALVALSARASETSTHQPHAALGQQLAAGLGLVMIGGAVIVFDASTPFPGRYTLVPVLGTVLLILYGTERTVVGRWLGAKFLVGLGLISYSAYLWHQPLFAFARQRSFSDPGPIAFLLLAVLALILAYLSWRFVERPCRNRKRLTRQQVYQYSAGCSVALVAIGCSVILCVGYPERLTPAAQALVSDISLLQKLRDDQSCYGATAPPHGCIKGDPSVEPHYALIGDSHASALAPELDAAFRRHHLGFVQMTKAACPLAPGLHNSGVDEGCAAFQSSYLRDLANPNITGVIISARWEWYLTERDFDNGEGGSTLKNPDRLTVNGLPLGAPFDQRRTAIEDAINVAVIGLLHKGKRVFLVYPVPEQGRNTAEVAAKGLWFGASITPNALKIERYVEYNADALRLLDGLGQHPNLIRLRPDLILCNTHLPGRCASQWQGAQLYYDGHHLSNAGAQPVVAVLMQEIAATNRR